MGATQNCSWAVIDAKGCDTSSPIVQSNTGSGGKPQTLTLNNAFGNVNNATIAGVGVDGSGTNISSSDFTVLQGGTSNQQDGAILYKTSNDTTIDATTSNGTTVAISGIELKALILNTGNFFELF